MSEVSWIVCCPLGRVSIHLRQTGRYSLITPIRDQPFTKIRFTMFRLIWELVHPLLLITSVYGSATKPDWRATSWTLPPNVTQRFIDIAGGEDALQEQFSS